MSGFRLDETEWQDTKDCLRTRIGMALVLLGLRVGHRLIDPDWLQTLLDDWQWELKYGEERKREYERYLRARRAATPQQEPQT